MVDPRRIIEKKLEERNFDMKTVSIALGKNHAYLQQFIRRGIPANLPEDVRHRLSEYLDIPEEVLGAPIKSKSAHTIKGDVLHYNIYAGLGGGGNLEAVGDEAVEGAWSFPEPVKAGKSNLANLASMEVRGESMEPEIQGGSWVLIDTTQTHPQDDIYALDYGDGLLVKRLSLIPKSDEIEVKSANPAYSTRILKREDVRVHGRVVGHFKWRG